MSLPDPPMVTTFLPVPSQNVFTNAQPGSALVLHKTAGWTGATAQDIAQMFINAPDGRSSHFIIGQDGTIVQCVHLQDGAGANCCVELGHDPFWDSLVQQFGNLNTCTISIEHVDPSTDNSTPLTPLQQAASFALIKWLVGQYGFDVSPDGKGEMKEIKGHNSIDPLTRARCPGNYPWQQLIQFLGGATTSNTEANQVFQDEWNACAQYLKNVPWYSTGIAQSWQQQAQSGKNYGPPLGAEFDTVTWNGIKIKKQLFSGGWCEWTPDNVAHWYSYA